MSSQTDRNPIDALSDALVDNYPGNEAGREIVERLLEAHERLAEINKWFGSNPYWRLTDDHRDFKQGHAREMEQIELEALIKKLNSGEAL